MSEDVPAYIADLTEIPEGVRIGNWSAYQEAKSSMGLTGPTASQRGGGLPQVERKVYHLPGHEAEAFAELTEWYQKLLDWRPAEDPS